MSVCDETVFQSVVNTLVATWPSLNVSYTGSAPKQAGLSFGSCYTCCGSLGITDIPDLPGLTLDYANQKAVFSTCGMIDYAILTIPLVAKTIHVDVQVRASSPNTLYPVNPGDEFVNAAPATLSGYLLISVPVVNSTYQFSRLTTDFVSYAQWAIPYVWPDTSSVIYNAIDWDSILQQWNTAFTTYMHQYFCKALARELQEEDEGNNCPFPLIVAQTCNSTTSMPIGPCHPCDTCCKCLVQERCDGSCSECACVNCLYVEEWSTTTTISLILIVAFFCAWFLDLFSWSPSDLYAKPNGVDAFPEFK